MVPSSPTQTVTTLRAAAGLFQAGRHAEARAMLQSLLQTHPRLAEAHRMMAGSFFQTDDYVQAQDAATSVIDQAADAVRARRSMRRRTRRWVPPRGKAKATDAVKDAHNGGH